MQEIAIIGASIPALMEAQESRKERESYIGQPEPIPFKARPKLVSTRKKEKNHRHIYLEKRGQWVCSCGRKTTD